MATEIYNIWSLIVQGFVGAAIILTFLIYWSILKATKDATSAQNILALVNFLQAPHVRRARRIVRKNLKKKQYPWNDDEKDFASDVCSA
jgi:hypothetical protein